MGTYQVDLFVDNKHRKSFSCTPGDEEALAIGYLVVSQYISDASQVQSASFNDGKIEISLGDEMTFREQYDRKMMPSCDYDWSPKISEVKQSDIDSLVDILSTQPMNDGISRVFLMDTVTKESVMGFDANLEFALYKAVGLSSKSTIDIQSSMLLFQNAIEPEHVAMCRKIPIYVIAVMENFSDASRKTVSKNSLDQTILEIDDGDPIVVAEGLVKYVDNLHHESVEVTSDLRICKLTDFKTPKIIEGVSGIMFRTIASGEFYDIEFMPNPENSFRFEPAPDIYYRNLPIREVYSEPYRSFLYLERTIAISISWSGQGDKIVVEPKHKI